MTISRHLSPSLLAAAVLALGSVPIAASEAEPCCFANFRFAGGCMEVPTGGETCASILNYLNSFDSAGRGFCSNTTVRGGWSLIPCDSAVDGQRETITPRPIAPADQIRGRQPAVRPVQPQTAPAARDAQLLQVSAPLAVRFEKGLDTGSLVAGTTVTGTLEQDLVQGGAVIAPAGSEVTARIVPTSLWEKAGGDAFELRATGIQVGQTVLPIAEDTAAGGAAVAELDETVPNGAVLTFTAATSVGAEAASAADLTAPSAAWMAAFNDRDADALAALYTEDAVMLPPNEPAIFGRDAIRAGFAETFAAGDLKVEVEALEVVAERGLAYVAGRYRVWTGAGELVDRGKFLEIWRPVDGRWLIHRDIRNSSLPAPEAEE